MGAVAPTAHEWSSAGPIVHWEGFAAELPQDVQKTSDPEKLTCAGCLMTLRRSRKPIFSVDFTTRQCNPLFKPRRVPYAWRSSGMTFREAERVKAEGRELWTDVRVSIVLSNE